jgi:hypothetical protein
VITAVEQITDDVRAYRLTHRNHAALPDFEAGAHITVPIQLADGSKTVRAYSLTSINQDDNEYRICVKLDPNGHGGSMAIHQHWQVGTVLNIDVPTNYFGLHPDNRPAVLIAGGIGITAIMAMAEELQHRGTSFELHYTSQTVQNMAFKNKLLALYGERCHLYFSRDASSKRLDLAATIKTAPSEAVIYICGPKPMLESAMNIAESLPPNQRQRINFESFQ